MTFLEIQGRPPRTRASPLEKGRLVVVSHTDKHETIRIISARKASKGEKELYEEG